MIFTLIINILSSMVPGTLKSLGKRIVTRSTGNSVMLIIVLVALAIGATGGWYVTSKINGADQLKQAQAALEAQNKAVQRVIRDYDEQRALDSEILMGLVEDLSEVSESKTSMVEVNNYVPEDDPLICNMPVGSVMHINYARTGARGFLPAATGISDEAAKRPSTITRSV